MPKCARFKTLLVTAFLVAAFQLSPAVKAQSAPVSTAATATSNPPNDSSVEPKGKVSEGTAVTTQGVEQSPDEDDDGTDAKTEIPSRLMLTLQISEAGKLAVSLASYGSHAASVPASEMKSALESALSCRLEDNRRINIPSTAHYSYYFGSYGLVPRTNLLYEGTLHTTPIVDLARETNFSGIDAEILLPFMDISEVKSSSGTPGNAFRSPGRRKSSVAGFHWNLDQAIPESVTFRSGYKTVAPYPFLWLLAVLLAPLAIIYALGRKALRADVPDKAVVWFSFMRSLSWTLTLSQFVWWAAIETFHLVPMLRIALANTSVAPFLSRWAVTQWFGWIPPIVIWLLCYRISHPVQQKLRGLLWTKKELTLQALYSVCAGLIPIATFLCGLGLLSSNSSAAAVCFLLAFAIRVSAVSALQKLTGMRPIAVTSGPLRDHAFTMAKRAGVSLQQVYVIPSGKGQMANAFAAKGNNILFTDMLLQRMSQPEIDYVLGHEMTHLKLSHPKKLMFAQILGFVVGYALMLFLGRLLPGPNFIILRSLSMFAAITGITYLFSRRFEYAADAGAVELTGDPRAAISAKFKLAQLNMLPTDWSKWSEKWLTHPSSLRRAQAIARKANIPLEEIPAIVREGAAATPVDTAKFVATSSDKLYSSELKRSVSQTQARLMLAALTVIPCLSAIAALHLQGKELWQFAALAAAIPVALAALIALVNFSQRLQPADFEDRLKRKLEKHGIEVDKLGGQYVGLAPGVAPRTYERSAFWDVGYLFFSSDSIQYFGEETQFALRRNQITDVRLGPGGPSYVPSRRIYIAWRDEERGTCGVFNFGARGTRNMLGDNQKTIELSKRILAWRQSTSFGSRPLSAPLDALTTPVFRSVTAAVPGIKLFSKKFYNELVITGLIAALAAMLFGLKFHLMPYLAQSALTSRGLPQMFRSPGMGWYVIFAAIVIRILLVIPHARYKDKPVLVAQLPGAKNTTGAGARVDSSPAPTSAPAKTPVPVS